jgi:anti-sigma regulatory factor (Ser/Thr protein kinase)
MSTYGIINSDPEVQKLIETAFKENPGNKDEAVFLSEAGEILEFLDYTLPELVVINLSDPKINLDSIVNHIRHDTWILNLGIIGLFSHQTEKEAALTKKFKNVNMLTMLDYNRIRSHLVKSIQIVEQNRQLLFQREFTRNFMSGASGSFTIENDLLAVPLYSGIGTTILAQRGLISPDGKVELQLALTELIINAIEHGNCGITYEEKSAALLKGISPIDLVREKAKTPAIRDKKVTFFWDITPEKATFIVQDEGEGFDVKAHLEKAASKGNEVKLHGRGINMAASLSHELKYNAKGNQAGLIIKYEDTASEFEVPVGFSREQIVIVKKGEIVIHEGDPSDFLYYIASGTYEVLHDDKVVGYLSAQDIFMGEVSFLLNQRRSATIKATSTGKLILLNNKTFIKVLREYPHYGMFLSKLLAKRLVRSNDEIAAKLKNPSYEPAQKSGFL